jgi:hypothetical protein
LTASADPCSDQLLKAVAVSRLIRCTALTPVPHSRAVLMIPVPLASSARICSTLHLVGFLEELDGGSGE